MKLITLKYFEKKTKASLIRYIVKRLRKKSKKQLANFAYNIAKAQLPRLKVIKRRERQLADRRRKPLSKRKTKRKFSAKQLAAQRLFAKRAKAGTLRRKR